MFAAGAQPWLLQRAHFSNNSSLIAHTLRRRGAQHSGVPPAAVYYYLPGRCCSPAAGCGHLASRSLTAAGSAARGTGRAVLKSFFFKFTLSLVERETQ